MVRVSVFSPDDLTLVKGGPGDRRRFLDDTLVALAVKYDALRLELDRIVRQRNMLLRQAGGRLDESAAVTLDVWDAKLAEVGDRFGHARPTLVERIRPFVTEAYANLAGQPTDVGAGVRAGVARRPGWPRRWSRPATPTSSAASRPSVRIATRSGCRSAACRRAPTPRRASSGRWRCRCAWWPTVSSPTAPGSTPVLVLDDVLSELDAGRATALLGSLPHGQVVITTAAAVPAAARPGPGHARRRGARRRRRPAGVDGRRGRCAVNDDEPVPVTASLDGLLRSLRGGAGRVEVGGVFGRWEESVGPMIAAHVRPVRLEHGVLLVEVDEPAWSTQVRFLADDIRRRLREESGVEVASLEVRVRRVDRRR